MLREFEPDDADAVLDVLLSAEDYAVAATGYLPEPGDLQSMFYVLPEGAAPEAKQILVVVEGNAVVGVVDALVGWPSPGVVSVGQFLIHPSHQRRGVGSRALAACLALAGRNGITKVRTGHAHGWEAGERFLAAHGFTRHTETEAVPHNRVVHSNEAEHPLDLWTRSVDLGDLPFQALNCIENAIVSGRSATSEPSPEVSVVAAGSLARDEVMALYDAVGWTAYTRDQDRLVRAITGSHRVVVARVGGELVGLARSVSDGETIVYLQDVLVVPALQRSGVGQRMVDALFGSYPEVRQHVLLTDAEAGQRAFYEALGFTEVHDHVPALRAFVRLAGSDL